MLKLTAGVFPKLFNLQFYGLIVVRANDTIGDWHERVLIFQQFCFVEAAPGPDITGYCSHSRFVGVHVDESLEKMDSFEAGVALVVGEKGKEGGWEVKVEFDELDQS
jgi:hypothetical protein